MLFNTCVDLKISKTPNNNDEYNRKLSKVPLKNGIAKI
jgi:hypothetical protein